MGVSVVVTQLNNTPIAFLDASEPTITRRWCGGNELTFRVPVTDAAASALTIVSRAIAFYVDGVLRFRGRIAAPLVFDREWITVRAADPWYDLQRRALGGQDPGAPPPTMVFTNVGASNIAWTLINNQNTIRPIRIQQGTLYTSPDIVRSRSYDLGKNVAEAVAELVESGTDPWAFRLKPLDGVAGVWATFDTFGGATGHPENAYATDRPAVRFEFGDGTLDNLEDFSREYALAPVNLVRAANSATGAAQVAVDATSISTYDLGALDLEFTDISDNATLLDKAQAALLPTPPASYDCTPAANAPRLFVDFDAGDRVRLRIRHGAVDVTGSVRVDEATTTFSDNGSERLLSITLSDPAVLRVPRRNASERLFQHLVNLDKRIGAMERA